VIITFGAVFAAGAGSTACAMRKLRALLVLIRTNLARAQVPERELIRRIVEQHQAQRVAGRIACAYSGARAHGHALAWREACPHHRESCWLHIEQKAPVAQGKNGIRTGEPSVAIFI